MSRSWNSLCSFMRFYIVARKIWFARGLNLKWCRQCISLNDRWFSIKRGLKYVSVRWWRFNYNDRVLIFLLTCASWALESFSNSESRWTCSKTAMNLLFVLGEVFFLFETVIFTKGKLVLCCGKINDAMMYSLEVFILCWYHNKLK
jgi:hypothetical protein